MKALIDTYLIQVPGKPVCYNGAAPTGENLKAGHRETKIENDRIFLDRESATAGFPDTDGDGRRMAGMSDFGEGDAVTLYRSRYRRS